MLKQNYFKGWYFKCGSGDSAIALIPAFHRHYGRQTASLQVITKDAAFHVPLASLRYREKPLTVTAGSCVFSERGIKLSLQSDTLTLQGQLRFRGLSPLRYDIMGPFRWIPFCNADTAFTVCGTRSTDSSSVTGSVSASGRRQATWRATAAAPFQNDTFGRNAF